MSNFYGFAYCSELGSIAVVHRDQQTINLPYLHAETCIGMTRKIQIFTYVQSDQSLMSVFPKIL